jgi:hypothetical protein
MSRMTEEELQAHIEKGNTLPQADAKAYQKVFIALSKTPDVKSSPDFVNKIMALVEAKRKRAEQLDLISMIAGITGIVIAALISIAYLKVRVDLSFLNALGDYKTFILLGGLIIVVIQILDKKFVRNKLFN